MHRHAIDWLSEILLTRDAALAQRYCSLAEKVATKLSRPRVIQLLRLFLFPNSSADFTQQFTDELIDLDLEFKGSDNIQHLRHMAGLVIATTFGASSREADAFALGIRAANFPQNRVQPVQPAIVTEAEQYLRNKACRLRPAEFGDDAAEVTKVLIANREAVLKAATTLDEAKRAVADEAYQKSVIETIAHSHRNLAKRIEQLAEESGLLWWVLSEHSDGLQQPLAEVTPQIYALSAASEAAKRTQLLPPPPCIGPLLTRALKSCKHGKEQPVLADYLEVSNIPWRAAQMKSLSVADCRDLVPLCAALEKTEEIGDTPAAFKALAKVCPGVPADLPLAASEAAQQFYNELLFLRSLAATPSA
jgi:GTPase-associated system helical domain